MSKSLSQFPETQQVAIATRRLSSNTHGIGFWGARDFFVKRGLRFPENSSLAQEQVFNEAIERFEHDGKSFHTADRILSRISGDRDQRAPSKPRRPSYKPSGPKLGDFVPEKVKGAVSNAGSYRERVGGN